MSVGWEPCDRDETERCLARLTDRFAWSMADAQGLLIQSVQNEAWSMGYRLVNPRYEWQPTGSTKPFDDQTYNLACEGVERMSTE